MDNYLKLVTSNPLEELKIFSGKFISIGTLAKYPDRLKEYIEDLEKNCFDVKNFEVIVAIPDSDPEYEKFLKISNKTQIEIKLVRLPYKYLNAMKSHNIMISEISDKNTYFYINNSDRSRFSCENWDLIIKQYIGSVPDDMFFLRGSNFSKNMKSRKSAQDAFYNPEQWGVYSRKYLEAIDNFLESHTGHDGSCEMIQYFINKNKKDGFKRDILMPNIMHSDIRAIVSTETTGTKEKFFERYYINTFFYKNYFSKKGLELCKKASIRVLLSHIIWKNSYESAEIIHKEKILSIELDDNKVISSHSYKLSLFEYIREKYYYYYGVNHGFSFAHRFYSIIKYKKGFFFMGKIIIFFNRHIQNTKNPLCRKRTLFISYFFSFMSYIFTFFFLTEPISNEVEGLFRSNEFKKVLHGEVIKKAYKSQLYKKSLENISKELEERI